MTTPWMYTPVNPATFGHVFYPTQAYGYQGTLSVTSSSANGSEGGAAVASAAPTIPAKEQIMDSVLKQVDYYFSEENLKKDVFLRSKVRKLRAEFCGGQNDHLPAAVQKAFSVLSSFDFHSPLDVDG